MSGSGRQASLDDDWKQVPLIDLLDVSIGGLWGDSPGVGEVDVDVFRSTNFRAGGTLSADGAARRSVKRSALDVRKLRSGDILLEKSGGGPNQPVGRVCAVRSISRDAICGNFIQLLRPNAEIDESWLFYALWSAHAEGVTLTYQSQTTGIRNLRTKDYLARTLLVPPVDVQRRIADLAAAMDDMVELCDAEVQAARQLLGARVGAVANSLATIGRLDDYAEVRSGLAKGRQTAGATTNVPFLRAANVQDGFLDLAEMHTLDVSPAQAERFALECGDVLLVEGSGSPARLGTGWIWEGAVTRCIHQNHVFAVRAKELLDPRWLAYWITSTTARAYFRTCVKTSSGLGTINKKQVAALPIAVPELAMQQRLAAEFDEIRALCGYLSQRREALETLRRATLAAVLSGRHLIPDSYDRFLREIRPDTSLEAATV